MCKHIWQAKRSLRKFAKMNQISENVPLPENAKNNAQIRKHSPMLTDFKRFETKFPSATFLRLHKSTTNLKMGPKHEPALKRT